MRRLTLAFVCLMPWLSGCSDGCGEAPKESSAGPAAGGGASGVSGGSGSGGAGVEIKQGGEGAAPQTIKDVKQQAGPQGAAASAGRGVAVSSSPVKTEALPTGPSLADVDESNFAELVSDSPGLILLVAHDPSVKESKDILPILDDLSAEWAPKVAVRRLNVGVPALAKLLPGLAAAPVPSFALYRDGKLLSKRQGPPFLAKKGKGGEPLESLPTYLERLKIWLRDAIRARSVRR